MRQEATNPIDLLAIVLLCVIGLGSILLVWFAGVPEYGVISGLWRRFGVLNLFTVSFMSFLIAAAILRRVHRRGSAYRYLLLFLFSITSLPTVLFAVILCGKAISRLA